MSPSAAWVRADIPTRRMTLEITPLNMVLDDASLAITGRSPFDLLVHVANRDFRWDAKVIAMG